MAPGANTTRLDCHVRRYCRKKNTVHGVLSRPWERKAMQYLSCHRQQHTCCDRGRKPPCPVQTIIWFDSLMHMEGSQKTNVGDHCQHISQKRSATLSRVVHVCRKYQLINGGDSCSSANLCLIKKVHPPPRKGHTTNAGSIRNGQCRLQGTCSKDV